MSNITNFTCKSASACTPGVVLPVWMPPADQLSTGDTVARAFVYAFSLAYMFLGVSIISDRFMAAIEVITSQEREIRVTDAHGNKQVVMVRYWNETVSNLTLMALGSSAPEILLSVIEIFGRHFEAGDLGPNTIVGSAAYNLFVIIGYCILVVPAGEVRRIKHLRVFFVTASWSVFAYVWLYLILAAISPGVIDLWEAVLTFLFFPLTVITAYFVDVKIFVGNFLQKKIKSTKLVKDEDANVENGQALKPLSGADEHEIALEQPLDITNPEIKSFEENRREYINILKEMRQKNPDIGIDELQKLAEVEILKRGPKSRAYYRIQATRKLIGGTSNVKKKVAEKDKNSLTLQKSKSNLESTMEPENEKLTSVFFDPAHYTCFESVGSLELYVARSGGDLNRTILVDYKTENGSAEANSDFEYAEGTLTFYPNEMRKHFVIKIIDDDVYEEDEHFYVRLSNARYQELNGEKDFVDEESLKVVHPNLATVMILDDDHGGVFMFSEPKMEIIENIGQLRIKVIRTSGARGKVKVPYKTIDNTAVGGKDYEKKNDMLVFYNNEIEKYIEIDIVDDEDYQKNEAFFVELGEPIPENFDEANEAGRPRLGDQSKIEIQIKESKEIKGIVDKLLNSDKTILVSTSSWREQFKEAFQVNADDDDDDDEEGEKEGEEGGEKPPKNPSWGDYIIHFMSLFWKVLFAFVPPTDIWGGWACFVVSITIIGLLTAVIGDLASHFGCTVGLKDSVTAISFVALGTSLPDTFASKVAAIQDKYADSSVGNVTGSNAVNVFLGIGLAWTAAAIYHTWNGTQFRVDPGNLGFSVTLFCTFAFVAITMMMIRRMKFIGGELGGPFKLRIFTACLFFGLWILYLLFSSLESYCIIKGF